MNDFFLEQSKLVCGLCRMSSRWATQIFQICRAADK
jgi:hypothetical protein